MALLVCPEPCWLAFPPASDNSILQEISIFVWLFLCIILFEYSVACNETLYYQYSLSCLLTRTEGKTEDIGGRTNITFIFELGGSLRISVSIYKGQLCYAKMTFHKPQDKINFIKNTYGFVYEVYSIGTARTMLCLSE